MSKWKNKAKSTQAHKKAKNAVNGATGTTRGVNRGSIMRAATPVARVFLAAEKAQATPAKKPPRLLCRHLAPPTAATMAAPKKF